MASSEAQDSSRTTTKEIDSAGFENTWTTAHDSKGRRSLLLRRDATGGLMTWAEEVDRTMPGAEHAIVRKQFRRIDGAVCWYLFEDWRSSWVRTSLQIVSLPILLLRLGFDYLRFRWELSRYSRSTSQQRDI